MTEGTRYRIRYDEDEFSWQFQRKRLAGEHEDEDVEEEPEETDEDDFGLEAEAQPGYRPASQRWAEMDAFFGGKIWIRWVLSTRAYRRLESEEPGQAVFTGGEEEEDQGEELHVAAVQGEERLVEGLPQGQAVDLHARVGQGCGGEQQDHGAAQL